MQGKKRFTPKLFYSLSLEALVPEDDFYRKISRTIDFHFLYKSTEQYYGAEGNPSIDPVVFFKICMVGYLNNICSDRFLIRFCSNSLNVRLFLGYDLDEELPWHSTVSRTRMLFGEEVFLSLFKEVLCLCVEKGMVSGKCQAMDSAFIKANASMDSLLEKEVLDDVAAYANELNEGSQYKVAPEKKKRVEQHHKYKAKHTKDIPGSDSKKAKFLSNHTHYSPTDPDARIATKPGKPRHLNFSGQLSVDTSHHVIIAAGADFADKRDSQCLEKICEQTIENLQENEIELGEVLADTGYSSGAALAYLDRKGINAWIPNFGQFSPSREGFVYNKEQNQYECQRGNRAILPFKSIQTDKNGYIRHTYRSSESVCKNCEHRTACCGERTKFKRIERSEHHDLYLQMHEKLTENKQYAQRMKRLRSATVEPVLGTLINFLGMKKVNTRGIAQAEKHVLMASLCYNLKKMLKFKLKKTEIAALSLQETALIAENLVFAFFVLSTLVFSVKISPCFFRFQYP
ncbi:MAG: IS1182 family transposase [Dysgonamonadaceae bacterium]|jgi:transposase|nr:IS1182 family transposase [Dysgonamonadaceae bacterium]